MYDLDHPISASPAIWNRMGSFKDRMGFALVADQEKAVLGKLGIKKLTDCLVFDMFVYKYFVYHVLGKVHV